ncbi:MAG: hypothetical protein E6K69_04320 [Nitrospirae bacterium]|nr:MAG: hypothetical protein E6K69_04320 [Nitrospirota bacterium]
MTMKLYFASLFVVGALTLPGYSALAESKGSAGLDPLKFLVGDWQGKGSDGKSIQASYQLTSGDTSLLETITPGQEPSMTTLYYLDSNHLMLTHYCSLGNQPRMVADIPKGQVKTLRFAFLDATNLESPTTPHMHKVTFTVQDKDHFTQEWVLSKDGKEMPMVFTFERKK